MFIVSIARITPSGSFSYDEVCALDFMDAESIAIDLIQQGYFCWIA